MNDFDTELNVYLEGMQAKQDGLTLKAALNAYDCLLYTSPSPRD